MVKRTKPKHSKKNDYSGRFGILLLKCIVLFLIGSAVGYLFFYFFKDFTVSLIDKYKFLQGIFGMHQYEEGVRYISVLGSILIGNIISTAAYFILGYFKALIPMSVITGILMMLILFAGAAKRQSAIPQEVLILFSIESFYRCLALTGGEFISRNKMLKKNILIILIVIIFILVLAGAFYEIYQIFGYIF